MKKVIIALLLLAVNVNVFAQEADETTSKSSFDLGMDVYSRYIWRGIQLGNGSASAQPWVEFSSGDFAIGGWGAYNLGGDTAGNEADLYVSYSPLEALSFTVTDYYFPGEGGVSVRGYGYYDDEHVMEGMVSFSGVEKFPIGIMDATNFAFAATGETYVQLSYETKSGLGFVAGGVFGDDDGYYGTDGEGIINLGISKTKEIKITDSFSLPVTGSVIYNPDAEAIHLIFGFSL